MCIQQRFFYPNIVFFYFRLITPVISLSDCQPQNLGFNSTLEIFLNKLGSYFIEK